MNKLKKRIYMVEDAKTETNHEVEVLVKRQYEKSKSEKTFQQFKAKNQ